MHKLWTTRLAILGLCGAGNGSLFAALPDDLTALKQQPVQLVLEDGRMPRGILSPRSNAEWYILRTELPHIEIESRFSARIVRDIQLQSALPLGADKLTVPPPPAPAVPEAAAQLNSETIPLAFAHGIPTCAADGAISLCGGAPLPTMDPFALPRSLQVATTLANWDTDAENDGLLLRVMPLNGWGQLVPVDGDLDVHLLTETQFATGGRTVTRQDRFQVTERWSVPVQALDFDVNGVTLKLPFRRIRPERDFDLAPEALLTARLRVPSAGALDASDPFVRLRPQSRLREEYFLFQDPHRPTGHR